MGNKFTRSFILAIVSFLSLQGSLSYAAPKTNILPGNWDNPLIWNNGTLPQAGDDVTIAAGTTVTLNIVTPNLLSLTISGTLNTTGSTNVLSIAGNITNNGTINLWTSDAVQADVTLQGASVWSGTGTWNLAGINLSSHGLEFASGITLTINRDINSGTGGSLNKIAKRSDITFNFYGSSSAAVPSSSADYYYGNINIDKTGAATDYRMLRFLNSASANTINILGNIQIATANDRLYPGFWNTLAINNGLSGSGYIIGVSETNGPSISVGGNGAALTLNIFSKPHSISGISYSGIFRDFTITRPSGVTINSPDPDQIAFRFNFTVDNSTVTLGNNILFKIGSTLQAAELNNVTSGVTNFINGGRLIGGATASFDLSGNAPFAQIVFDESSTANQTLKDFSLTKLSGTGELRSNLRVTNIFNLSNALSSLSISAYTLTLNGTITATGAIKGSSASNLVLGGTITGGNTFRFLQTDDESRTLKSLSINRTGTALYTFNLTNNLNILDNLTIGTQNRLGVNANTTLNLRGSVSGAGDIQGSATSNLIIDNQSAAEINPLKLVPNTTFQSFVSNRTAGVVLNGSVLIRDALTLQNTSKLTLPTNGTFTLGVGGTTPTPGTFNGNGFLSGSATSNLSIRGSSSSVGIRFSQTGTENRLGNFTIEKSTGIVTLLNSNLFVDGELELNDNSKLAIGNGTLTLRGLNLNTSGEFIGSPNSNLAITGTGTVARTIRFNQTDAASRTLKTFSQTRNITVTVGNRLDITDRADVNGNSAVLASNGNLTLLATASTNASIGPLTTGSITGDVNIQSYFTGGSAAYRGTRLISSPVNDAAISGNKTFKQMQANMVITGPGGESNGFDRGNTRQPNAATLYKYNEVAGPLPQSQFINVAAITEATTPGLGYLFFYRGDRTSYTTATATTSPKLNTPFATPENTVHTYTGPINKGDVTVNLSYTPVTGDDSYNGLNLVGNPYPSVIDWSLLQQTNMLNFFMIIKPQGGYATNMNGILINTELANSNYIQPGQGFYVRALGTGASLVFKESAKAANITSPLKLLASPVKPLLMSMDKRSVAAVKTSAEPNWKQLRMNLQDDLNKEEAVVVFDKEGSASAGAEDAPFFSGSSVSLSTMSADDKSLSINFMPELADSTEIKLNIGAAADKTVTLNFSDLAAAENYQVFLKDNYLDTETEIQQNSTYSFEIKKSETKTFGSERLKLKFILIPSPPVVVIENLTVEKTPEGNDADIEWTTVAEENTDHFVVEHSTDGNTFTPIAEIPAAGSPETGSEYTYVDEEPAEGVINYYRIKEVDVYDKFTVSKPESVDFGLTDTGKLPVNLYPNPASDEIRIDLKNTAVKGVNILISDAMGKKVISQVAIADNGQIKQNIAKLRSGIYIVQLTDSKSNQVIGKSKFIKN